MISLTSGELLVEVERSGVIESLHRGHVIVLDPDGSVRAAIGDVDGPVFPRSSLKPVQAVAMLRTGLALSAAETALACASHSGEPMHVAGIEAMLAAGGLDEADLECPPDLPLSDSARRAVLAGGGSPRRVYMNCSGTHAAMLRAAVVNDWPLSGYCAFDHPAQHHAAGTVAELAGEPVAATGVDGCGAPIFAISLRGLARAFGRIATSREPAEQSVAAAMRTHPELVGGSEQVSTLLMAGIPGAIAKGGAEGVFAAALADGGCLAIKVDDGAMRAAERVVVAALRRLGGTAAVLDDLAESPVLGGGARVGTVRVRPGAL